ncbi:glycosyltransferase [Limisalsivibrio acetivorans]|uniref:glycosyltransferase n=1 Tax=Limisalsivibrio acetivorans TaxID=1304888 RepID=UPI0003B659CF|nr:glycosyltransferase [Limisalsivibrio acetivorans]
MAKADLHCHSKFSNHPTEWFLQRLGSAESYTEPDFIYNTMKERGMDFVTVTDHNKIDASMYLHEKHPEDTFTGVESTVYFPEDGCKIHCLVYGLNESQFSEIQKIRRNIYDFRDYIREQNLAYSLAHGTYSVNNRLKIEHLEKLVLLFDVFEGINGGRGKLHNQTWVNVLEGLTPEKIDELYDKYRIEPFSTSSWIKGFTGGSDDHAGLFLGNTYTITKASTPEEFINKLRTRQTRHAGNYSNFHTLAFTVYKIAYDFTQHNKNKAAGAESLFNNITNQIFTDRKPTFMERLRMKGFKIKNRNRSRDASRVRAELIELVEEVRGISDTNTNKKLEVVYDKAANIADEYLKMAISGVNLDKNNFKLDELLKSINSVLPGIFLSVPFFTSFTHMYKDRGILDELERRFSIRSVNNKKRILWFTDTINDLNGVSVTLRTVGRLAAEQGYDLKLIGSLTDDEVDHRLPENFVNLKPVHAFKLPYYEKLLVKIPSVLKSLEDIYNFDPDEVYISTPGPVGLLGLLASKLLSVKSYGIYHTDFTKECYEITGNDSLKTLVESYTRWFFDAVVELKTTSREYMLYMERRGISREKMSVFNRGIDTRLFRPVKREKTADDPFVIAYAGRISKDKNLEFYFDLCKRINARFDNIRFVMAGDGPFIDETKSAAKELGNMEILNEIEHDRMPEMYASSDLFVFPSNTDTFGMVVLEAQACGVPAVVSDEGGPKEIIKDGETGFVCTANNVEEWEERISSLIEMARTSPAEYEKYSIAARARVMEVFNWDKVLQDIFLKKKPELSQENSGENGEEPGRRFSVA